MHIDQHGHPFEIGEYVIVARGKGGAYGLDVGEIINVTQHKLRIKHMVTGEIMQKDPSKCVVITKQIEYNRDTYPENLI